MSHPLLVPPPTALEAEQAVLGSMLLAPRFVGDAAEKLSAADFYLAKHRTIWLALLDMERCGLPIDLLSVAEELRNQDQIDAVGGTPYLILLQDSVPTALHWEHYAEIVADKSLRRRLIDATINIHAWAHDDEEDPGCLLDRSEEAILSLGRDPLRSGLVPIQTSVHEEFERLERAMVAEQFLTGTPSGLTAMDDYTQGFQPGDLIIVAGRPSMGKSSFAHCCAVHAAQQTGKAVLIFSLEMSRGQVTQRMICAEARVDSMRLRSGILRPMGWGGESDMTNISRATGFLGALPIHTDDSALITPLEIRARARRLAREQPIALIIIDYLQQIRGTGHGQSRNQEVGETARALKSLARELNVPVMALSQLSRNTERRDDKRPLMSDLRESGDLESEADLILMLYRGSYYARGDAEETTGMDDLDGIEVSVAKHRNGPTGTVHLGFLRRYARFENLAKE